MQTLLIATHRRGFECDPIIDILRDRHVPVFRFNCENGDVASALSIQYDSSGVLASFSCDGRTLEASDIGLGWLQQLPPFIGQPQNHTETIQNENLVAAYFGLLGLLDIPWLNSPRAVMESGNKILQLSAASRTELRIPETLISNQPQRIRSFCTTSMTVIKNLATPWILNGASTKAAYTAMVDPEWLQNDDDLISCPAIYQRFRKRAFDYRVVIVGNRTFVARCKPQVHQEVDIRRGSITEHEYEPCRFDEMQLVGLKKLLAIFGLSYCSADFMEDEHGIFYFLDLNSCGAWWWIDTLYRGEIRAAICDYFIARLNG